MCARVQSSIIDLWCWHNPSDGPFFFFSFSFLFYYYFEVTERQLAARPTSQRRIMKKKPTAYKKRQRASNDAGIRMSSSVVVSSPGWFSFLFFPPLSLLYVFFHINVLYYTTLSTIYTVYFLVYSICRLCCPLLCFATFGRRWVSFARLQMTTPPGNPRSRVPLRARSPISYIIIVYIHPSRRLYEKLFFLISIPVYTFRPCCWTVSNAFIFFL